MSGGELGKCLAEGAEARSVRFCFEGTNCAQLGFVLREYESAEICGEVAGHSLAAGPPAHPRVQQRDQVER